MHEGPVALACCDVIEARPRKQGCSRRPQSDQCKAGKNDSFPVQREPPSKLGSRLPGGLPSGSAPGLVTLAPHGKPQSRRMLAKQSRNREKATEKKAARERHSAAPILRPRSRGPTIPGPASESRSTHSTIRTDQVGHEQDGHDQDQRDHQSTKHGPASDNSTATSLAGCNSRSIFRRFDLRHET